VTGCGMSSNHLIEDKTLCRSVGLQPGALTMACPAKLNVFLEVLGKRPDGYHELDTVMLRTDFSDQLTAWPSTSSELTLRFSESTPAHLRDGVPLDECNLILRAANAVRQHLNSSALPGAQFVLHKRIPPESGLGGGSSNAAAALLLCRKLWQVQLEDSVLHSIAASLGSDINFLLSGCAAAVCRGRGELIQPVALKRRFSFVAVRPLAGNSTPAVFRSTCLPSLPRSSEKIVRVLTGNSSGNLQDQIFNRLTEAAMPLNPGMASVIWQLQKRCQRPVFMSGSGSTVFVVADSYSQATAMQLMISRALNLPTWLLQSESESASH